MEKNAEVRTRKYDGFSMILRQEVRLWASKEKKGGKNPRIDLTPDFVSERKMQPNLKTRGETGGSHEGGEKRIETQKNDIILFIAGFFKKTRPFLGRETETGCLFVSKEKRDWLKGWNRG